MNKWKKIIVKENIKIRDAVKNLNKSSSQIALVVDRMNNFVGTITDGDIRRSFLKGSQLSDSIKKIINKKPIIVSKETPKIVAINIMRSKQIKHMPIIEKKKILGIHFLNEKFQNKKILNTNFVIIAGGKGKRLMPLTKFIPKPMLKIKNKPILEHILIKARNEGFKNFTIIVHHLKEQIIDYFENGKNFDVNINYLIEKKPLGTAGGLKNLSKKISKQVIISNSDVITDLSYKELLSYHLQNKSDVTMAIKVINKKEKFGLVKLKGIDIKGFEEKPLTTKYINSGVYVFNKNLFKNISGKKEIDMISFLEKLKSKNKRIKAFPIFENWSDIGIKRQFYRFKS